MNAGSSAVPSKTVRPRSAARQTTGFFAVPESALPKTIGAAGRYTPGASTISIGPAGNAGSARSARTFPCAAVIPAAEPTVNVAAGGSENFACAVSSEKTGADENANAATRQRLLNHDDCKFAFPDMFNLPDG